MSAVIHDGELSTPPDASGWLDHFGDVPKDESTQAVFTIFDDVVTTDVPLSVYSNPLLHGLLGAYDQIAIELTVAAMASESEAPPYLGAQLEHSGDGRSWVNKRPAREIGDYPVATPSPLVLPLGFDDGTIPSLAFVRLRLEIFCDVATQMYLTAKVTVNNTRERAFVATVRHAEVEQDCDWVLRSGHRRLYNEGEGFSFFAKAPNEPAPFDKDMTHFADAMSSDGRDWHQYFTFDPWLSPPYSGTATLKPGYMICGKSGFVSLYDLSHGLRLIFIG